MPSHDAMSSGPTGSGTEETPAVPRLRRVPVPRWRIHRQRRCTIRTCNYIPGDDGFEMPQGRNSGQGM